MKIETHAAQVQHRQDLQKVSPVGRIDTHVHFWKYNSKEFSWVRDPGIQTDFMPEDFQQAARPGGYDGCINVQARFTYEENDFMLDLAGHHDFIKGVVGWVSLLDDRLDYRMQVLAQNPKLVGVRDFISDCLDADGRIRHEFAKGLKTVEAFGKVFELVINENQLSDAIVLAREFPGLNFVIDHMAKPKIKDKAIEPWATKMKEISKLKNVFCKVSGIATEANPTCWAEEDFKPYLDVVFTAFEPTRLMIGSDWPVCLGAGTYSHVMSIVEKYMTYCSDKELEGIYGGNAMKLYGIP